MSAPRTSIVELCKKLIPETKEYGEYLHWHQVGFDNLAKDYGQGFGTTCGFLPHWLLWRFGCRDNTLVNRSEPPEGLTYFIGENLSILQDSNGRKAKRPSWVKLDTPQNTIDAANGRGPKPGDFVIIRGGFWMDKATEKRTVDSAHVFVLLDILEANGKTVKWRVAQSGVRNHAQQQGAHIMVLTGTLEDGEVAEGGSTHKGPNLVFFANIQGEEPNFPRRVIGYTDLDKVGFGAGPSPKFLQMILERWITATTNDVHKVNAWFGWYELTDAGGFIPLNKTYILLHRGHEAYRLEKGIGPWRCTARGAWTLAGNNISVAWDDATPDQAWTMATTWVPKPKTSGTPTTANTGALVRVAELGAGKKPPEGIMGAWRVE